MEQKEKLINKLKSNPRDMSFDEVEKLLGYFSFIQSNKGRTSGSRVMFISQEYGSILLHKPHPRNELLDTQVKHILEKLEQGGLV